MKHLLSFDGRPKAVSEAYYREYYVIFLVSLFCIFIHALFIPFFWWLGLTVLALFNVVSVAMWTYGFVLNMRGKHHEAVVLVCAEVVMHSIIATAYLGLDAGFQHYLWAIAGLTVLNTRFSSYTASLYGFAHVLLFGLMYVVFANVQYQYAFPELLPVAHFVNVLIAGVPLTFAIGAAHYVTVHQEQRLTSLAITDPLTGLYNRRYAFDMIENCLNETREQNKPVSFVIGDIDLFKKINDEMGHEAGDRVLKEVALLFKESTRESDMVARWGGEEFLIVMPDATAQEAFNRAEDIRLRIHRTIEASTASESRPVTMSFGVTQWQPYLSFDESLNFADKGLYECKAKGRNQVCLQMPSDKVEVLAIHASNSRRR